MGKKKDLTPQEKQQIVTLLAEGCTVYEVARLVQRDVRTVKKYTTGVHDTRKERSDAGFRKVSAREMRCLTRALKKMPGSTSKAIFNEAAVERNNRATRNNILNDIAKVVKIRPRLPPVEEKHAGPFGMGW